MSRRTRSLLAYGMRTGHATQIPSHDVESQLIEQVQRNELSPAETAEKMQLCFFFFLFLTGALVGEYSKSRPFP